jgi:hypothetical protein
VLTFAVVASRTGRPLDPSKLEEFDTRAAGDVPFPPDRHVTWTNDSGTVWFAAWQAPGQRLTGDTRWHVAAEGLTAYAGRVWPRRDGWLSTAPVATQLAQHLLQRPLVSEPDELAGSYVVASMAREGRSSVAADPLGIALLHWGQRPDVTVISTRAAVAASILADAMGTAPRRDTLGAGWLAYAGNPMGARTGYEGITLVPGGTVVEIDPVGTIELHRPAVPVWRLHADVLALDPHTALDEARAEMMTAIRMALRDPDVNGRLGLTGGKDSRLVLSLLLADGAASNVEYWTYGDDDLPDVVIARRIAATFGLRHVTNPGVAEVWAWRQRVDEAVRRAQGLQACSSREIAFRATAWSTSGMRNVGEPHVGRLPPGDTALLSGLFGELLRTNYHHSTQFRSKEQAARLPDNLEMGGAAILARETSGSYRAEAHELLFEGATDCDSPQDIIDAFYLRQRLRHWLGPTLEIDTNDQAFPLYSLTAIRLAFGIGAENRRAEWIHYHLMRAACEPLVHLPFTSGDWPLGAREALSPRVTHRGPVPPMPPPPRPREIGQAGVAGLRRQGVRQPNEEVRTALRQLRAKVRSTDLEVMRKLFRHDSTNPAFDIIDSHAALDAVDRFEIIPESQRMQLYGALTAVIWLGGHEVALPRELSVA